MHRRSNQNSNTTHPDPSLLNQGYTFFPPGSNSHTSNMRGVIFSRNTSIISGSWGSYIRMDVRPSGSMANMDGSDRVNHDRQDGRGLDSSNEEMETACQSEMNGNEPLSNEDFPPVTDPGGYPQSYIQEAISPEAGLHIHHANTSTSIHIPRVHEQRNDRPSPASPLRSHNRTNGNVPTRSTFFSGASDIQITGTPTFNNIVDGVAVESREYGPGPIDDLEFGTRLSPGQSPTPHQNQSYRSRYEPPAHSHRRTMEHQPNIAANNFRPSTSPSSQDRTRTGAEYSEAPIDPLPPHPMGGMGDDRALEYMWTLMILALVPLATFWVSERGG